MAVQDHGRTLVHGIDGRPRNMLHSVSVDGPRSAESFYRRGYKYLHGWIDAAGRRWDVLTREEWLEADVPV